MTAEVDPVGTDPLASAIHAARFTWVGGGDGDFDAHLAAALQPLIDAEKAEAVREALDEVEREVERRRDALHEAFVEAKRGLGIAARIVRKARGPALEAEERS